MPLVAVHKARRRVKTPAYQKLDEPSSKEQRDTWIMQANNERRFSRAFMDLVRRSFTDEMKEAIRQATRRDNPTPDSIIEAMPFYHKGSPESQKVWESHVERLRSAYKDSINEAAANEARRHKWPVFEIIKQEEEVVEPPSVPALPVDPTSIEWMEHRSLTRAVELSIEEENRIRAILTEAYEEGLHANSKYLIERIQETVGLTPKQYARVRRRVQAAMDAGMNEVAAETIGSKFAEELRLFRARAQARTETMDAIHTAMQDTWNKANEEGLMPPGTLKQAVAADLSKRTSKICRGLHLKTVPFNQPFTSNESQYLMEEKMGPPFHPNCRTTTRLIFPS